MPGASSTWPCCMLLTAMTRLVHERAANPHQHRLESLQLEGCSLACGLEHHVAAPLTRLVLSSCTTPPDVVPPVRGPDALRTLVRAAPFLHTLHMIGPAGSACGLHGVAGGFLLSISHVTVFEVLWLGACAGSSGCQGLLVALPFVWASTTATVWNCACHSFAPTVPAIHPVLFCGFCLVTC